MTTETRFVKAAVRPERAQGIFQPKVFELTLTVTGSYHAMAAEAIAAMRAEGFETSHIISHSYRRDCL